MDIKYVVIVTDENLLIQVVIMNHIFIQFVHLVGREGWDEEGVWGVSLS